MIPESFSIGREAAIALAATEWWKSKTDREVAEFQILCREVCMNFGDFQMSLERALGRPVWTHELALNAEGLKAELFEGAAAPTFDQILGLIPPDKRIVVVTE